MTTSVVLSCQLTKRSFTCKTQQNQRRIVMEVQLIMRNLQLQFINDRATARRFQLLDILEHEQFVTTQYLAKKLGASQRTIMSDIQELKIHFGESVDFKADSSGYRFIEKDNLNYVQNKQELLSNEPLYEIIGNIFYGEFDTLEETADYLNYSPGSLRRILQTAQPVLRHYGLSFQMNPIKLNGDESGIRRFFFDFYYEGSQTSHSLHPPKNFHQSFIEKLSAEAEHIELDTGVGIASFYFMIYIAFERYRQGFKIHLPDYLEENIIKEPDFARLTSFIAVLGEEYGFSLSQVEVAYIHYRLLTQRAVRPIKSEIIFYNRFCQWPEIEFVAKQYVADFPYEGWDKKKLVTHFKSFFLSLKIKETLSPVLNKVMEDIIQTIQHNQITQYQSNLKFINKNAVNLKLSSKYIPDIAANLTIFADLLAQFYAPKKNIYFLIEGDESTRLSIRLKATNVLGAHHNLTFLTIWFLSQEKLDNEHIDLIVTNYSPYISEYITTNNYVLISPIPEAKDWQNIFIHLGLDPSSYFR